MPTSKQRYGSLGHLDSFVCSLLTALTVVFFETPQEFEAKAAQMRQVANDKKKVAKEAKDEACKTRFGGKVLCIRPLNSGY